MNHTIRELLDRKSVRSYTDREISQRARRVILNAAMAAPTAGNQQMYTILDIQDPALKQKLSVLCDNQPFIARGKMVLVFCADYRKWYDTFTEAGAEPRDPAAGDLMLAVTDTCIAAQNAVVAAQSLGIGSCYIGDVMEQYAQMKACLHLPQYVFPCAMLVFGYPTRQQRLRKKPERCALSDIVCVDTYARKSGEDLRRMFAKKHGDTSFDQWARAFCERKYNSEFSREMSKSVEQYLKEYGSAAE